MGKAPAYQMYAQDFDMDTASWPNIAVGIYQRLLNYEWINEGLPEDLQELASIAREKRKIFERNWIKFISKKFHENGSGLLTNKLLKTIPLAELQSLLEAFFASEDKFIQGSGYTIGVFKTQINKLKIGTEHRDGVDLWLKAKEVQ